MADVPSTETETETNEAPVKVTPLVRSAIGFFEFQHNRWSAVVPRGTTKERLLQSGLWSVVSDQFKAYDLIYVLEESRAFYAQLLVLDCGRGYCSVQLLNFWPLPALLVSEAGLPPGFDVFYAGPINNGTGGYCVKRVTDGVMMAQGHSSKDLALAALLESATLR
ncbi:hypothetical protein D3C76_1296280 [compost metagenome]